ncbi:hypothetical protein R1sor_015561 [Riccia sorocarpa]|uniref:Peptidase A2 domain-containing protein n=1 Tax=Riccia sorocarpa TaxID=122646 RepID=A0ABD3HCK8_9MARC
MISMAALSSCVLAPSRETSLSGWRREKSAWRGFPRKISLRDGWKRKANYPVRAAASSEGQSVSLKNVIEQVEKMRASAIKEELSSLGISYADCFEKQELVIRLANARVNKVSRAEKTTASRGSQYPVLAQMPLYKLRSSPTSPKNYILVPLKINNQGPFNFILDTGSSVTLVNPSIVYNNLKLTPQPSKMTMALLGGGLSNQSNLTVNFREVKIGNHPLSNVTALLMDAQMLQGWEASAAGLLGLNVLSQFDIEFDFLRDVLVFYPPGAARRGEYNMQGMAKLATSEVTLGILGVKIALGKAPPELALLDLGSSLCVATPDIARLAGVSETILQGRGPGLAGGGMGQPGAMKFVSGLVDVGVVSAGDEKKADFTIKQVQFAIGEVPSLRAVGCRILLGLNVFTDARLLFSQSTKSVFLQRPKV